MHTLIVDTFSFLNSMGPDHYILLISVMAFGVIGLALYVVLKAISLLKKG